MLGLVRFRMRKIGDVYYQTSDWQQLMWQELERVVRGSGLSLEKFRTALDIGCGSGSRTSQLRGLFPGLQKIVAIDNNASMLAAAREKIKAPWIDFRLLSMTELDELPESDFDLVVSHCALHWAPDKSAVFGPLSRKVKPGAILVFATSEQTPEILAMIDERIRAYLKVQQPTPLHFISLERWRQALREQGWKIISHECKTMIHKTEGGMPYLKHWFSASAGAAFYGHDVDKLPADFTGPLLEEISRKFPSSRAENIEFPEKTVYVVARYK
jgi:trans-aconitate methyltransferase